jgi:hypothetical protein
MPVRLADLEFAYLAANSGPLSAAWIHRDRSEVRTADELVDEDEPPPADEVEWVEMPSAETLGLKQELVREFCRSTCPELTDRVRVCFTHRGAWGAFKDLLDLHGYLDRWHAYQDAATERALIKWAGEHSLTVIRDRALA